MDKATAEKIANVISEFKKIEWRQGEEPLPLTGDLYEAIEDLEDLILSPAEILQEGEYPETIYIDRLTRRWFIAGEHDEYGIIDNRYQSYKNHSIMPATESELAEPLHEAKIFHNPYGSIENLWNQLKRTENLMDKAMNDGILLTMEMENTKTSINKLLDAAKFVVEAYYDENATHSVYQYLIQALKKAIEAIEKESQGE